MNKKICYIDLDGVLADFEARLHFLFPETKGLDKNKPSKIVDDVCQSPEGRRIFNELSPIEDAQWAYKLLCQHYDVYILSTPMWLLPESYMDKRLLVEEHLGQDSYKKLILSHNKGLLKGHYLIDDRKKNGVEEFEGMHIHFGMEGWIDWKQTIDFLSNLDGWKY